MPSSVAEPTTPTERLDRNTTTIVVGIDGSASSWSALWWAAGEATRVEGRIIAVYVSCITNPGLAAAAVAGIDATAYMEAREAADHEHADDLKAEIQQVATKLGVRVDFLHLRGDPAEQLVHAAHNTHADIISVGRSTNLRHRLAGSLGRKLTRSCRSSSSFRRPKVPGAIGCSVPSRAVV